jgi:hypothetical protein
VPDAELQVIGRICGSVPRGEPGVATLGLVEDLRPAYARSRIVINPAVAGTGLAVKTIEALCHFRPIVAWPNGAQGLAPEMAALCTTVRDWHEFAERTIELLAPEVPRSFSPSERDIITRASSPETAYGAVTRALDRFFQKHESKEPADTEFCV